MKAIILFTVICCASIAYGQDFRDTLYLDNESVIPCLIVKTTKRYVTVIQPNKKGKERFHEYKLRKVTTLVQTGEPLEADIQKLKKVRTAGYVGAFLVSIPAGIGMGYLYMRLLFGGA